jgi:hypothetical protein
MTRISCLAPDSSSEAFGWIAPCCWFLPQPGLPAAKYQNRTEKKFSARIKETKRGN